MSCCISISTGEVFVPLSNGSEITDRNWKRHISAEKKEQILKDNNVDLLSNLLKYKVNLPSVYNDFIFLPFLLFYIIMYFDIILSKYLFISLVSLYFCVPLIEQTNKKFFYCWKKSSYVDVSIIIFSYVVFNFYWIYEVYHGSFDIYKICLSLFMGRSFAGIFETLYLWFLIPKKNTFDYLSLGFIKQGKMAGTIELLKEANVHIKYVEEGSVKYIRSLI
jgi:hypothetical protein